MVLKLKKQICDEENLLAILKTLALNISAGGYRFENLALIGILRNGVPIAKFLADRVSEHTGVEIPVASLDITLYRDDMIDAANDPFSRVAEIPFPVKNREIILVDDVLFTGRTVRAALSSLLALGRPRLVNLAVVVDRGHRELPISADYVGLTLTTTRREGVRVRVQPNDIDTGIYLYEEEK